MSQKRISDFFKDPVGHGSTKRQNTTFTTVCVLACLRLRRSSEEGVFYLNVKFVKTIKSVSLDEAILLVHKNCLMHNISTLCV